MTLTESEREEIIKMALYYGGNVSSLNEAIRLTEEKIEEKERQKRKEMCRIIKEKQCFVITPIQELINELKEKGLWEE